MTAVYMSEYWMGRDVKYHKELTREVLNNASDLVMKVNELAIEAGWKDLIVSSGWRPPAINAVTKGAAKKSKHMTGQAIDLADPDRRIRNWCMDNQNHLEKWGLWMEHPDATSTWCHLQTVPPVSGKRVFYP